MTILRGVERNKATINVTPLASFLWYLQRLSPGLVRLIMKSRMRNYEKARTG